MFCIRRAINGSFLKSAGIRRLPERKSTFDVKDLENVVPVIMESVAPKIEDFGLVDYALGDPVVGRGTDPRHVGSSGL